MRRSKNESLGRLDAKWPGLYNLESGWHDDIVGRPCQRRRHLLQLVNPIARTRQRARGNALEEITAVRTLRRRRRRRCPDMVDDTPVIAPRRMVVVVVAAGGTRPGFSFVVLLDSTREPHYFGCLRCTGPG